MALAAKLLVGALVLGAGSTATYVAVTGGFGAGGNGTESEASGETQAVASPVPRAESAPEQVQQNVLAGGVSASDQVLDSDANERSQELSTVTDEGLNTRAEQPQVAVVGSGVNVPEQGVTTGITQTPAGDSPQSLSGGSNDVVNAVDSAASVGGGEKAEVAEDQTANAQLEGKTDKERTDAEHLAQSQPAGQVAQTGHINEKEALSPSVETVTVQGSTTPGGAAVGAGPGTSGSEPNSQETNPVPSN